MVSFIDGHRTEYRVKLIRAELQVQSMCYEHKAREVDSSRMASTSVM